MVAPSLQHFETFLVVANSGGFTAAAKQLGVSKAAVSNSIRLLEESLGVPLFIRTTRQVRLTEEGELLVRQCERLQQELDAARSLVADFDENPTGTLRINCNLHFAENWLTDSLSRYIEKFPDVKIDVISDERVLDMDKEQIDIVFGVNWPPPLDVVARTIGQTRYIICASPTYIQQHGSPNSIKDLEDHRYIPHAGRNAECRLGNLKKPTMLQTEPQLIINNASYMKICALKGMGIVQLHDYMVRDELASGELVELLVDYAGPAMPVSVYYQKHRFVQPKIRQFINLLVEGKDKFS
jgi:DNA-binding transcriptional LysR family regulator